MRGGGGGGGGGEGEEEQEEEEEDAGRTLLSSRFSFLSFVATVIGKE